ncbi:LOW QUALITY PROTEIN: tRNA-queuosine alpha-mannosyltransferase [Tachypleus tridentatus]|uniref:LOW QUALITY PROTEIN: tRNA-queuosine alpha-mannosyltransferase n=1 Tax=Tachypleus tridentatus TaxID=6853 RepID=UPI003FD05E68
MSTRNVHQEILLIEPFYGGSHKQLVDTLVNDLGSKAALFTLPAKKWHWRARTSALYFSRMIPKGHSFRVLFASSVLNLAELVALRPDLLPLKKILYFHENQLLYPVQKEKERDFQYGYNQIVSSLVADTIVFNSKFNQDSFLATISSFFNKMPDYRPKGIPEELKYKCRVIYFPLMSTNMLYGITSPGVQTVSCRKLHIVWPHRWEHDKGPEEFFDVIFQLHKDNLPFVLSVIGEQFSSVPDIFQVAQDSLKDNIKHWGHQDSKDAYFSVLRSADVVISTARHEFFGVAMLEAAFCGCYPLAPRQLVYPEIFPDKCLYNTKNQLLKKLRDFCCHPDIPKTKMQQLMVGIASCVHNTDMFNKLQNHWKYEAGAVEQIYVVAFEESVP